MTESFSLFSTAMKTYHSIPLFVLLSLFVLSCGSSRILTFQELQSEAPTNVCINLNDGRQLQLDSYVLSSLFLTGRGTVSTKNGSSPFAGIVPISSITAIAETNPHEIVFLVYSAIVGVGMLYYLMSGQTMSEPILLR